MVCNRQCTYSVHVHNLMHPCNVHPQLHAQLLISNRIVTFHCLTYNSLNLLHVLNTIVLYCIERRNIISGKYSVVLVLIATARRYFYEYRGNVN